MPFEGKSTSEVVKMARRREINFSTKPLHHKTSESAKDLLRALLAGDERARLTAKQALKHPWLAVDSRDGEHEDDSEGDEEDGG